MPGSMRSPCVTERVMMLPLIGRVQCHGGGRFAGLLQRADLLRRQVEQQQAAAGAVDEPFAAVAGHMRAGELVAPAQRQQVLLC